MSDYEKRIKHVSRPVRVVEEQAKRFNIGKVDYTLIPVAAQKAEAKVWMAGEKKYGRSNWKKLWGSNTVDVVLASIMRHTLAIQSGQHIDPETGEYHAAHLRCNAAMLIEYYEQIKDKK